MQEDLTWPEWFASLGARLSPKVVIPALGTLVLSGATAAITGQFDWLELAQLGTGILFTALGIAAPPQIGMLQSEVNAEASAKRFTRRGRRNRRGRR